MFRTTEHNSPFFHSKQNRLGGKEEGGRGHLAHYVYELEKERVRRKGEEEGKNIKFRFPSSSCKLYTSPDLAGSHKVFMFACVCITYYTHTTCLGAPEARGERGDAQEMFEGVCRSSAPRPLTLFRREDDRDLLRLETTTNTPLGSKHGRLPRRRSSIDFCRRTKMKGGGRVTRTSG